MFPSAVLAVTLAAAALAAPQSYDRPRGTFQIIPILSDNRNGPENGVYDFSFETGNGISYREQGAPTGPNGAVESQGGWSFTFPDGTPAQFSFVADENGYRVDSPLLPTPPPLPAHAIEQIEKARQEAAAGITYDSRGRRISGGRGQSYN